MSFSDLASALAHQGDRRLPPLPGAPRPAPEPEGPPPPRRMTVTADDGVELHVEVQDAPGAALTIDFCHGYLLNFTSWDVQRTMLAGKEHKKQRDHQNHGRAGWGTPPNA